jgi:hypothetical protein
MIHKGDVSAVQCVMNLRWSNSKRDAYGPSFFFIDFKVLALAPRLDGIQTALQLSENITLFAIRGIRTSVTGKEGQIHNSCL